MKFARQLHRDSFDIEERRTGEFGEVEPLHAESTERPLLLDWPQVYPSSRNTKPQAAKSGLSLCVLSEQGFKVRGGYISDDKVYVPWVCGLSENRQVPDRTPKQINRQTAAHRV